MNAPKYFVQAGQRIGHGVVVADHLDDDRWHNVPENLVPACRRCNSERSRRADFLTHCEAGHEWTPETTYMRPDGIGRQCRPCNVRREAARSIRRRLSRRKDRDNA